MAGNARFHDKLHRKNHHTLSSYGFPDSAIDPIASHAEPFQGDFVINGNLSTSAGLNFLSADLVGDLYCENIHVRGITQTNFISGQGTETIISDGVLTGHGDNTLTMDYETAIYSKVNNNTMLYINSSSVGVGTTTTNERLTIDGNISFDGTSAHYISSPYGSDKGLIVFGGTTTGVNSYLVHPFYNIRTLSDGRIDADASYDIILPYQQRRIVYGSENVTRSFLVSGTTENPLAVKSDAYIASLRGFAYSGNNKFNTLGGGGNASVDIRTSGDQSLINGGGYITVSTMPMNSGTSTGAIERMRITSEGNVGIGTGTPQEELHVSKTQAGSPTVIRVENTSTANASQARVDMATGTANAYSILYVEEESTKGPYTSWASGEGLIGGTFIRSASAAPIGIGDSRGNRMVMLSSGNVGINENIPNEKLTVNGNISASGHTYSNDIYLNRGDSNREGGQLNFNRSYDNATSWAIDNYNDDIGSPDSRLRFINYQSGIEVVTILSSGNVGIGTQAPTAKLDIIGDIKTSSNINASGSVSAYALNIGDNISSFLTVGYSYSGNSFIKTNEKDFSIIVNSVPKINFLTGGNIGINTDTPNKELTIIGDVSATGDVYSSNIDTLSTKVDTLCNGFNMSLSSNGYQVLPSGLIMQWGFFENETAIENTWYTVNFPINFTTICFNVNAVNTDPLNADNHGLVLVGYPSVSSVDVSWSTTNPHAIFWQAIGY